MNFLREDVQTNDDIIRGTNDDATVSRLSAVTLNYLQDPFVKYFVKRPVRRSPIINRGTFIRCHSIDSLVSQFLQMKGPKKQIVSLGSGFDTRYLNIKAGTLGNIKHELSKYVEIDFPEITMKKAMALKRNKLLENGDVKIERGGIDLISADYCIIGGDLRNWGDIAEKLISKANLDVEAPTLFVSECVFIYIKPEESSKILQWITNNMKNTMFVLYEQIQPNDAFGQMMIRNLKSRNIELKGIEAFPDLSSQEKRFIDLGWQASKAITINTIHDNYLSNQELSRISKLEILDELEEWRLLSAHYCIAWAVNSLDYKDEFSTVQLNSNVINQ